MTTTSTPGVTTTVGQYLVCVDLPGDHSMRPALTLTVTHCGQGRWAVRNAQGKVADARGRWQWDQPAHANPSAAFLRRFRHTEADALALAQQLAPRVRAIERGRTAAHWARQAQQERAQDTQPGTEL